MLNNIKHGRFHLSWQILMPRNPKKLSVACFNPQVHILTGENHLQKILVVQEAISIGIIEVYESLTIILGERKDSAISQELEDVPSIDVFLSCTVYAHESTVRGKVGVTSAKLLTQLL